MFTIRKSQDRGYADHGWLKSYHTFSFADYYDEKHMNFRHLRVINEDWVEPANGFGTHPHSNMEIITYVVEGALEHKDSMGTGSVIRPGDVQMMSAGTGVTHSEFNHSKKDVVHLLQIWIIPNRKGIKPDYRQKTFSAKEKTNQLCLVGSPDKKDGSLIINQDVNLYACLLDKDQRVSFSSTDKRYVWIQLIKGNLKVNKVSLAAGDGLAVENETQLEIKADHAAEFLLFDLS